MYDEIRLPYVLLVPGGRRPQRTFFDRAGVAVMHAGRWTPCATAHAMPPTGQNLLARRLGSNNPGVFSDSSFEVATP
eukprot:scaffold295965_cov47-Prasinocladus_malaysianus.AAC.1